MRKLLFLCLFVMAHLCVSAQSLIGNWVSEELARNEAEEIKAVFTLNIPDSKSLNLTAACKMEEPNTVRLTFEMKFKGTYTKTGNELTFNLDPKEAQIGIKNIEYLGEAAEIIKEQPELEEALKVLFNKAVEGEKDKVIEELPLNTTFIIDKLTDKQLTLTDKNENDRETLNFNRAE